jgi:hypothetical protein
VSDAEPLLDRAAIEDAFCKLRDHPGLRVSAASPEHLLAMKVLAARRRDAGDIRFLVRHLQIDSVDGVLALCAEVFPDEPVPDRARLVLEDVFPADPEAEGPEDTSPPPAF